jgi:GT2 family glycosyltransferase
MRHLEACLASVRRAMKAYGNAELILIDNGSTDGSYERLLSESASGATVCQMGGATIAALRNRGAELARGEYLSFVDSDCLIPQDYLLQAMEVFATVPTDATGCMYDLPPTPHWIEQTWRGLHGRKTDGYVDYLNAGNLIVRKGSFEKVGGFDERLTTGEDAELGQRLQRSGFRVYESSKVSAVHLGNAKTLGEFFRKQVWYALGMFGSFRSTGRVDRPLLMTFAHLGLSLAGLAVVFLAPLPLGSRLALLFVLLMSVPAAAVLYRMLTRAGFYRPLRSLLLYQLYFTARTIAMGVLAARGLKRRNHQAQVS